MKPHFSSWTTGPAGKKIAPWVIWLLAMGCLLWQVSRYHSHGHHRKLLDGKDAVRSSAFFFYYLKKHQKQRDEGRTSCFSEIRQFQHTLLLLLLRCSWKKATVADMNRENPTVWNSPTESEEMLGEKHGSYLKKKMVHWKIYTEPVQPKLKVFVMN